MSAWDFWNAHPFIAWCALWLVWMVVPLATLPLRLAIRTYRCVMVCARGWPPPHVDADGDWKPAPESAN